MEIKNIDDDKLVVTYDCQTRGPSVRVNTRQVDLKKDRRDEFDSAANEAYYAFNEAMSK